MTSNRVHDAARYGTHHINIADNSLDNREFTHHHLFPTSEISHVHLNVFLICSKHFGVDYVTLKCFTSTITESEKNSYTIALVIFNLSLAAETKHHTQTTQAFHAEPCLPEGQPCKKSSV